MNEGRLLNHKIFSGLIASATLCSGRALNFSVALSYSSISDTLAVYVRYRAYVACTQY